MIGNMTFPESVVHWGPSQPKTTLGRLPRSNRTAGTLFATAPATPVAMVTCHSYTQRWDWHNISSSGVFKHVLLVVVVLLSWLLPRPDPCDGEQRKESLDEGLTTVEFVTWCRVAVLCTIPGGAVSRHVFSLIGGGILWRWLVRAVPIGWVATRGLWLSIGLHHHLLLFLLLQHILHLIGQL